MKLPKGRDYSTIIVWSSALVGMIRYAAAFLSSDLGEITGQLSQIVTWMLGISGFFMGILGTLGTVYIFDGWRQKIPRTGDPWSNKFVALTIFVFMAITTEILILVPFTMSRVLHISVAEVLHGGVWWWSTAVVIMPFLLIGGVAVGNQIVSVSSGNLPETFRKDANDDQKLTGNFPNDWRKVRKLLNNEQMAEIAKMTNGEISYTYGVTERTASNWRNKAQAEVAERAKVQS